MLVHVLCMCIEKTESVWDIFSLLLDDELMGDFLFNIFFVFLIVYSINLMTVKNDYFK